MFYNRVILKSKGQILVKNLSFNDIFLKNKHINNKPFLLSAVNSKIKMLS